MIELNKLYSTKELAKELEVSYDHIRHDRKEYIHRKSFLKPQVSKKTFPCEVKSSKDKRTLVRVLGTFKRALFLLWLRKDFIYKLNNN